MSGSRRRDALVSRGLTMLERTPLHALSIDEVAEREGISRSLLFHYFPTKQDYLDAVVRAGVEHVLTITEVPDDVSEDLRSRAIVTALVRYIHGRRASYLAVVRSAEAGDEVLALSASEMRDELCRRVLASCPGSTADGRTLLRARGWLAGVEEMVLHCDRYEVAVDELVEVATSSIVALVARPA